MNARFFLLLPGLCGGLALSASAAASENHADANPIANILPRTLITQD